MSYCCRSNCQRHGVLLLLAVKKIRLRCCYYQSRSLGLQKTIVIGLKVLEDVLVSTDNDSSSATRSTSLPTTAARLHSRHSCTRHDDSFILLKSLLRTQPLDKERRSKQNRREVRSSLLVDRFRAMYLRHNLEKLFSTEGPFSLSVAQLCYWYTQLILISHTTTSWWQPFVTVAQNIVDIWNSSKLYYLYTELIRCCSL